jgi:hypothetical protein
MPDEDRTRARIELGRKAEELLANETFQAAIAEAQAATFTSWRKTGPEDSARREWLYQQLVAFEAIPAVLRKWSSNGTFEFATLQEGERAKARSVRVDGR